MNVNWEKIHSIILCVTCYGLRNFVPAHTHPLKTSHEFLKSYEIIFWVRVTHKMLNVNWEKIHSIILCVTCHGLRNFPLLIHIPSYPFMNFWNPINFMCDLSWLKKFFPCSYTSPHIHSWIFKTLWVIIFWVRVTHKMLNMNWEKIHSIILCVTCHGLRNFAPTHTHPLKTSHEFTQ